MNTTLPFHPNVCLIILNRHRRIFLGERLNNPGEWQLPQGGIDAGSTPSESALREASEELGAPEHLFTIVRQLKATHQYDFPEPVPPYARGVWRGQRQTFWLLNFAGEEGDIDLAAHEAEFRAYQWCSLEQIPLIAAPHRLGGYQGALTEVREFLAVE